MIIFVDTETTGLDPDVHEIWEVAAIAGGHKYEWRLPVDLGRADARALSIGRYHERVKNPVPLAYFAERFAEITRGAHLAGMVVSFDEERLRKLLRANGACPEWNYHLVDVEALTAGKMGIEPPWNSEDLSRAVGVEPNDFARHTALGDALWAQAIYASVMSERDR